MSVDRDRLLRRAGDMLPVIVEWRRAFHARPELGFEERETAQRVREILRRLGIETQSGWAGTGVTGYIRGKAGAPAVALRAELDALPIQEATGRPFASKNPGVMHACGHDGHMAALLGAAALLSEIAEELPGSIVFVFQPAEEMLGGGKALCEAGVLDDPPVDAIFGLHLWPWLPKGVVGLRDGAMMAAFDEFHIDVIGRSSHGASPHLGVDAVVTAARLVDALQHVVARRADPQESLVLTIGRIEGGTATNIVAERVRISGCVRTLDPGLRKQVPEWVAKTAAGVCDAHGARYEMEWVEGYPALVNDGGAVRIVEGAAGALFGPNRVARLPRPSMASEDFAYYLQRIPGAFAFFGVGEGPDSPGLHTPTFDFDETILADAASLLAGAALGALESQHLPRREEKPSAS